MRVAVGGMCLLLLMISVCGCNGGPKPLFTASDAPAAILDRAIEAQGGARYQECWKIGRTRYLRSSTTDAGAFLVEDTFELPRFFRRTTRPVKDEQDVTLLVVNGAHVWEKSRQGLRKLEQTEPNPPLYYWANLLNLAAFRSPDVQLSVTGDEKRLDRTLVILHTASEQFGKVALYLDSTTGLLVKSVKLIPAGSGGVGELVGTTELGDYRDLDGIKFPFHIELRHGGKATVDIVFKDVKFLAALDEELFAEPK